MVDIHRISAGNVNCYIVVDNDKAILIDTGRKRYRKKILDKCKEHHVSLIVLTHGHIENIFLAATGEGYACTLRVPLGNEGEWARDVLGYPEDYFMPCFIGIGKPKTDADVVKQKDIEVKERIHWDRW